MKSIVNLGDRLASVPLLADDVLEFHAARILLLIYLCGTKRRIDGLTKMAKLDFFVRYPQFFDVVQNKLEKIRQKSSIPQESSMVRHRYGPWDKRYYHVLPVLEAKSLAKISRVGKQFQFELTDLGLQKAKALEKKESFVSLVAHMKRVKKLLGSRTGSALKRLIYETFDREIADKPLGETIEA